MHHCQPKIACAVLMLSHRMLRGFSTAAACGCCQDQTRTWVGLERSTEERSTGILKGDRGRFCICRPPSSMSKNVPSTADRSIGLFPACNWKCYQRALKFPAALRSLPLTRRMLLSMGNMSLLVSAFVAGRELTRHHQDTLRPFPSAGLVLIAPSCAQSLCTHSSAVGRRRIRESDSVWSGRSLPESNAAQHSVEHVN